MVVHVAAALLEEENQPLRRDHSYQHAIKKGNKPFSATAPQIHEAEAAWDLVSFLGLCAPVPSPSRGIGHPTIPIAVFRGKEVEERCFFGGKCWITGDLKCPRTMTRPHGRGLRGSMILDLLMRICGRRLEMRRRRHRAVVWASL